MGPAPFDVLVGRGSFMSFLRVVRAAALVAALTATATVPGAALAAPSRSATAHRKKDRDRDRKGSAKRKERKEEREGTVKDFAREHRRLKRRLPVAIVKERSARARPARSP